SASHIGLGHYLTRPSGRSASALRGDTQAVTRSGRRSLEPSGTEQSGRPKNDFRRVHRSTFFAGGGAGSRPPHAGPARTSDPDGSSCTGFVGTARLRCRAPICALRHRANTRVWTPADGLLRARNDRLLGGSRRRPRSARPLLSNVECTSRGAWSAD